MKDFYVANRDNLSIGDVRIWAARSWEGVLPDAYEGLFTEFQTISSMLVAAGTPQGTKKFYKARSIIQQEISAWHKAMFDLNKGKAPTEDAVRDKIGKLMIVITDEGIPFVPYTGGTEYLGVMSQEQLKSALEDRMDSDPKGMAEVYKVMKGRPLREILELYESEN